MTAKNRSLRCGLAAALLVAPACNDDESGSDTPLTACSAAETGNTRCDASKVQTCDGSEWTWTVTCGQHETCVEMSSTAAECQRNGPSAEELNGLWLITSMTFAGPPEQTFTRGAATGDGLVGDELFTANGSDAGVVLSRVGFTADNVLVGEPAVLTSSIALEGNLWIAATSGTPSTVEVYALSLEDVTLTLTYQADDPRNTSTDAPTTVVLTKATAPWGTQTVGDWEVVTMMTGDGQEIPMGTCLAVPDTTFFAIGQTLVSVSQQLVMERTQDALVYADAECSPPSLFTYPIEDALGLLEVIDNTARFWDWSRENNAGYYAEMTITESGSDLTLTTTACAPMPSCEDSWPTVIELTPAQ